MFRKQSGRGESGEDASRARRCLNPRVHERVYLLLIVACSFGSGTVDWWVVSILTFKKEVMVLWGEILSLNNVIDSGSYTKNCRKARAYLVYIVSVP